MDEHSFEEQWVRLYDHIYETDSCDFYREFTTATIDIIQRYLDSGTVIDYGAGTGRVSIQISMDGKGRALDNIWIERYWKSLKYNHVYLNPADKEKKIKSGIEKYISYYKRKIHHTTFETPNARYECSMLKAA